VAFKITNEWIVDIPDKFEHRVEDEKMIFWTPGITVIAAAFRVPENTNRIDLLSQIQGKIPTNHLEIFVSTKGELAGLGYTQVQKQKGEKDRLSLVTFTASDTSCPQMAYYLDDPQDLVWAQSVWEHILFQPSGS